jgi:adenylate cyclase class 2
MHREIEAKFRLTDPEPIRGQLAEVGAALRGRVLEYNRLLDTAEGRLRRAGCGLRVRTWRVLDGGGEPGATLTFKGPRESTQFKARLEIETPVPDPAALLEILGHMGFHECVTYEKRRETWQVGPVVVVLDELPRLGWYLEIEGPDEAAVAAAQRQLGLADTLLVAETYPHLAGEHGDRDADGIPRLVFAAGGR